MELLSGTNVFLESQVCCLASRCVNRVLYALDSAGDPFFWAKALWVRCKTTVLHILSVRTGTKGNQRGNWMVATSNTRMYPCIHAHTHTSLHLIQLPFNSATVPPNSTTVPYSGPVVPHNGATQFCHSATQWCHSATQRCHTVLSQCHTMVPECHPTVPQCHPIVPQCHLSVP